MTDIEYMLLAIELAKNGLGAVSPNPPVGCVVVSESGEIVGRGWHQRYGEAHAEVNALEEAGVRASGATAYVTLMPCNHHGKTPPCTQALINAGIKRVVVSVDDPDPTSGSGAQFLRSAGVEVGVGVLREKTARIMHGFIKYIQCKLPHITLKYAMTLDGCIATESGDSKWISSEDSRDSVQLMRSESDAVMVGSQTLLIDDPRLNVRDRTLSQPFRVIIDSKLVTPVSANIFTESGGRVIILTGDNIDVTKQGELKRAGAEILLVPITNSHLDLKTGLQLLAEKYGVRSILCEGGGGLAGALVRGGLVDRITTFIAPKILGGNGISPTTGTAPQLMKEAQNLVDFETKIVGGDVFCSGWIESDK